MGLDLMKTADSENLPQLVSALLPIVEKNKREIGLSQTKAEITLGNLQFSGEKPITWLKQCLIQINDRASSLKETYWNLKEQQIEIDELREEGSPRSLLKAERLEDKMLSSKASIETTCKELEAYQAAADKIREAHNLPDEITDVDHLENSKREHVRLAMHQAARDVLNFNVISKGVIEHLEEYGVHPQTAHFLVCQYRDSVNKMISEGQFPSMAHMNEWLSQMEELLLSSADDQLRYMRLAEEEKPNA